MYGVGLHARAFSTIHFCFQGISWITEHLETTKRQAFLVLMVRRRCGKSLLPPSPLIVDKAKPIRENIITQILVIDLCLGWRSGIEWQDSIHLNRSKVAHIISSLWTSWILGCSWL